MCVCSLALHFSAGSSWKSWRPLSCMKFARSLMVLTRRVIFFPVQSYLMCKGRVKYAELALRACRGCQASLMCSHIFLSGRCKRICYLLQRQVTMCSSHVEKDKESGCLSSGSVYIEIILLCFWYTSLTAEMIQNLLC